MPYVPQTWVNNVTPVDAARMLAIEAGIDGTVEIDNVAPSAGTIVANRLLLADTQPAFKINGVGTLSWGPGGATAPDTSLYRTGAANLASPGNLTLGGFFARTGTGGSVAFATAESGDTVNRWLMDTNGKMTWSLGNVAADTTLYRASAGTLQTDGQLFAVGQVVANLGSPGVIQLINGEIRFNSDTVARLYRASASTLQTDGLLVAAQVNTRPGGVGQVSVGSNTTDARISFGSTGDTTLYRSAANALETNSTLRLGGSILLGGNLDIRGDSDTYMSSQSTGKIVLRNLTSGVAWVFQPGGALAFGYGEDTNLYRSAANVLKTDGDLRANGMLLAGGLVSSQNPSSNQIILGGSSTPTILFGNAQDTNLYRSAAGTLKTDGALWVGGVGIHNSDLYLDYLGAGSKVYFGSASDTNLYRKQANYLRTDGTFEVGGVLNAITAGAVGALSCSFGLNPNGVGARTVMAGDPDSAGAGWRVLRVAN